MKSKAELRRELIAWRTGTLSGELTQKSQAICDRFIKDVEWSKIATVHVYKAVSGWHEVDTAPIIEYLGSAWPDIKISKPSKTLSQPLPKQKFDVILAPTLGFDKNLNRLGRGGGWYDKFLAAQPGALKVGLCFSKNFINIGIPVEPHDIQLDKIVTEVGIMDRP